MRTNPIELLVTHDWKGKKHRMAIDSEHSRRTLRLLLKISGTQLDSLMMRGRDASRGRWAQNGVAGPHKLASLAPSSAHWLSPSSCPTWAYHCESFSIRADATKDSPRTSRLPESFHLQRCKIQTNLLLLLVLLSSNKHLCSICPIRPICPK